MDTFNLSNTLCDNEDLTDFTDEIIEDTNITDPKKCIQCKDFYVYKDNKCSFCIKQKCVRCNTFFVQDDGYHCSECIYIFLHEGKKLSLDDILNLKTSIFKRNKMEENLEQLFDLFKVQNKISNKLIKNKAEFNIISSLCKKQTPKDVYLILSGQKDVGAVMLPAKYADILLDECMSYAESGYDYRYIHAIAPFIFDIWNMVCKLSVFVCYYNSFEELTCPSDNNLLFGIWYICVKPPFLHDLYR